MYKDNSKINVSLLAEVGDIANRLRSLDKRLALNLDDPRYQQELQQCPAAAHCSSESKTEHQCSERRPSSAAQIAQDIGDRISGSAGTSDSEPSQQQQQQYQPQRRYSSKQVEDIILEFYEKHLIYHQSVEKERLASATAETTEPIRSRIYRLTDGHLNNMSNLPSSKASNKCSSSNLGDNADSNVSGDNLTEQTTKQNELTAELSEQTTAASGKRNSIANQPMPEIQISNSDEPPKTRKSLTEPYEPKEPTAESTEEKAGIIDSTIATGGSCGHYCAGWQTSIWNNQLDENVLRTLVMELKHKIEFTERMNWLCKYHQRYDFGFYFVLFFSFLFFSFFFFCWCSNLIWSTNHCLFNLLANTTNKHLHNISI